MLRKLLFYKSSPVQAVFSVTGSLLGLTLVLCAIQFYVTIDRLINSQTDLLGKQYLVIQKSVGTFNFLSKSNSQFSEDEIADLIELEGVSGAAPFKSNYFQAAIFTNEAMGQTIPKLYSDIFFESIPDEFIDIDGSKWQWFSGDTVVPIILPKDYLNLYNFGFAPGQNLPQLTPNMISLLDLNLRIRGDSREAYYHAYIAGFSTRINSILVPETFLDMANSTFGGEPKLPSRIIIRTENAASSNIEKYLATHGYESNHESLRNGKLNGVLQITMFILFILGGIIIALALISLLQNAQLLINKSEYELRTLSHLGYSTKSLSRMYVRFYLSILLAVYFTSLGIVYFLYQFFKGFMEKCGYEIPKDLSMEVYILGSLLVLALSLICFWGIRRSIRNIIR